MTGLRVAGEVRRGGFGLALDFSVAAGEVLGVLGPNGAGKTTLLRTLAGLGALSRGRIELAGVTLDDPGRQLFVPAERRPVGLVFQNYRLFPHLSVRDNVAFAARARGAHRQPARQRADGWLDRLGLAEFAARKPAQLSGGQAQRVALARALAADPGLLLLDEPLAALDARTRLEVRGELRRHLSAFGGPSLVVTHDPLEAMVLTDRLLVIEDGRVVQQGSPAEVARRPASQYVARLMGLNLYRGSRGSDGAVALDGGGVLHAAGGDEPPGTGRVLVAVRPSAISLHTEQPRHASPRNVWPGTVTGVELLTDRVRVQVGGSPPALVDITPDAVAELDLAAGSPVWLSAKATEIDCYPDPR
ncbi:ABC transporter ATP-binding protein [Jatrophihabitans sp.]|uniref:ABC transporter ATP-binding protein n=1 Tax=Jatrophihabitans sp. TaxID=1932789 RepID=UPI002EEAB3E5